MYLHPCPHCRRHVRTVETRCPYCTAALARPAPRPMLFGRASRAMVFGAALTAAACGSRHKDVEEPHEEPQEERHAGGGGCFTDDQRIAELEKRKAEAKTDEEKQAIDEELQRARQPVCMPYGAPPRRRRLV